MNSCHRGTLLMAGSASVFLNSVGRDPEFNIMVAGWLMSSLPLRTHGKEIQVKSTWVNKGRICHCYHFLEIKYLFTWTVSARQMNL